MAYLMEHNGESERIEKKTDITWTANQLTSTGLQAGMSCLDVGCASGSTTRAMSTVTNSELVWGLDQSEERLDFAAAKGQSLDLSINYKQGNAADMPLETNQFDYSWSRFLFEYLKEPEPVLAEMKRVTKPGGKVVVGDLDGNCVFHFEMPPHLDKQMQMVMGAAAHVGFDPFVGRKLYTYFHRAGLQDLKVQPIPYHCFAGRIPERDQDNWFTKLKVLAPVGKVALGSKEAYKVFEEEMKDFLLREDTFTYSTLLMVSGTVPE